MTFFWKAKKTQSQDDDLHKLLDDTKMRSSLRSFVASELSLENLLFFGTFTSHSLIDL
jgi:hypothetical protein